MSIKAKVAAAATAHMVLWLLMLVLLAGILFCAWGSYLLLAATTVGAGAAALIVGGVLIGLIVLIALIVLVSQKQNKRAASKTEQPRQTSDNIIENQLRPVLGNRATDWAKDNTGIAVAGALSAGLLLAINPRLRSFLVGAAGPLVTRKLMQTAQRFTDL